MATTINDLFSTDDYQSARDAGLIGVRTHRDDTNLVIANYTPRAMTTPGAWDNPAVLQCRGLIYDAKTLVVKARPFPKFFNYGQPEADVLDLDERTSVVVADKVDGSLGIIYAAPDGQPAVATRGSFHSEQAEHATKVLRAMNLRHSFLLGSIGATVLVEIIYPGNRIVCNYGDRDELVLLGGVDKATGYIYPPYPVLFGWPGAVVKVMPYRTLQEALEAEPRPGAEGMVISYKRNGMARLVKLKQDDYVALHRIVTGLNERTVWQHMMDGKPLSELLQGLPDELHQWVHDVWRRLNKEVDRIDAEVRSAHGNLVRELPSNYTRAQFAMLAKRQRQLASLLFMREDGKNLRFTILKSLKPSAEGSPSRTLEDAA